MPVQAQPAQAAPRGSLPLSTVLTSARGLVSSQMTMLDLLFCLVKGFDLRALHFFLLFMALEMRGERWTVVCAADGVTRSDDYDR